jgi:transposase-like protein
MAMYLFSAHKKGISSVQLGKDIKTKQSTAWFILQRLREASKNFGNEPFEGINEIDEAYIGGKEGNRHMKDRIKGTKDKAVILGMINRNTKKVKLFHTQDNKYSSLGEKILKNIKEGSTIITDELNVYCPLNMFYNHETINHSQGEYVKKDNLKSFKITTNSVEGAFGLFKRSLYGVFHWVSKKHLNKYLAEFEFRYSNRSLKLDSEKMELLMSNLTGRLTYKSLIA